MPLSAARPSKLAATVRWMRADDDSSRLTRRLFWTGFLIRVLYITLAHTYRFRAFDEHFQFGWEMGRIGRALATGHGFANPFNGNSGPTAWTPPLYPLLIGGVFKIFGVYTLKSAWVILVVNSVFSAATSLAIYEIALRCFINVPASGNKAPDGRSIALWSAWVWALYPAAMQYAVKWIWDMSVTAFFFACVVVLALRLRNIGDTSQLVISNRQPATLWALFGLFWGLIALSNSSLLSFLPACGLWILRPAWRQEPGVPSIQSGRVAGLRQSLLGSLLSAVVCLAIIAPWVVRNYTDFHAFVPMRSNFGAELYEATFFSTDGFPWGTAMPLSERAPEFQRYEQLGELVFAKQRGEIAKARIYAHPGLFASNTLRRIYFFWISVPHTVGGEWVEAIRRINFCFFSFSGILGLALAFRRHIPGAWLFFWAFAICPFIYYFVTAQARFRHPLEPIICILSVYLFQSADRTRAFSRRPAG